MKPAGLFIPSEWYKALISFKTKGVYLIADNSENLLYIGKCQYPPVIRLLDRMIPKSFNQLNNVPQIWDNFISQGKHIKCAYCYNLSFDPEILESYIIHEYCIQELTCQIYNRKMPTGEFLKKVLEIKSKFGL